MSNHDPDADVHAPSSGNGAGLAMAAARTDLLSQVLTLIRLRGELVYTVEARAPWGLRFPPGPAHFHLAVEGGLWVGCEDMVPVHVPRGGLVLMPHGLGHVVSDEPGRRAEGVDLDSPDLFDRERLLLRRGGDGEQAKIISGVFRFEGGSLPAILQALPRIVFVPPTDVAAPPWLEALARFMVDEAHEPQPGSALMISRLVDLLVIRSLRTWAAERPSNDGWLRRAVRGRRWRAAAALPDAPAPHPRARASRRCRSERRGGRPPHRLRVRIAFSRAFKSRFGYAPNAARPSG